MTTNERHVKSGNTSVPVQRSIGELERILKRYGCAQFGFQQHYGSGVSRVTFTVSDDPSQPPTIPVQLEINVNHVREALVAAGYSNIAEGHAERVAFRNLVLWVDSACAAAAVGLRPMSEAFFADLVVIDPDSGQSRRMFELASPHMEQALLPPGGTGR